MTGEAAVLAASELANSLICPGGSVRGFTETQSNSTYMSSIV